MSGVALPERRRASTFDDVFPGQTSLRLGSEETHTQHNTTTHSVNMLLLTFLNTQHTS